jgi:hypothetical protein
MRSAQSKTGAVRGYGYAEAPPAFQAGCSDCMFFSSLFVSLLLNWNFRVRFCTYEGAVPYRFSAQMHFPRITKAKNKVRLNIHTR